MFHLFVIGNMIKYSTIDTFNYKTSMFIVTLFIFSRFNFVVSISLCSGIATIFVSLGTRKNIPATETLVRAKHNKI